MTPSELRVRARADMQSAKRELSAGSAETASKLARDAAELALKARYCTRHKVANLPATPAEMRAAGLGKVATHDFEKLLELCQGVAIPRFASIDWASVADWNVDQRYAPVGSADMGRVVEQCAETDRLLEALRLYDTVDALVEIRTSLEGSLGPLSFFALDALGSGRRRLLVGIPNLASTGVRALQGIVEAALRSEMSEDLRASLTVEMPRPTHEAIALVRARTAAQIPFMARVTMSNLYGELVDDRYMIPQAGCSQPHDAHLDHCTFA